MLTVLIDSLERVYWVYDRRRCGDCGLPEPPTPHEFNVTTPHPWSHPPHMVGVCIFFVPSVSPALHVNTGTTRKKQGIVYILKSMKENQAG